MFIKVFLGFVIIKINEVDIMLRLYQIYIFGIYDVLFNLRYMFFGGIRIIGQEVSRYIG